MNIISSQPNNVITVTLDNMQISRQFAGQRSQAQADEFDIETLFEVRRTDYSPYLNQLWQNQDDLLRQVYETSFQLILDRLYNLDRDQLDSRST